MMNCLKVHNEPRMLMQTNAHHLKSLLLPRPVHILQVCHSTVYYVHSHLNIFLIAVIAQH